MCILYRGIDIRHPLNLLKRAIHSKRNDAKKEEKPKGKKPNCMLQKQLIFIL